MLSHSIIYDFFSSFAARRCVLLATQKKKVEANLNAEKKIIINHHQWHDAGVVVECVCVVRVMIRAVCYRSNQLPTQSIMEYFLICVRLLYTSHVCRKKIYFISRQLYFWIKSIEPRLLMRIALMRWWHNIWFSMRFPVDSILTVHSLSPRVPPNSLSYHQIHPTTHPQQRSWCCVV